MDLTNSYQPDKLKADFERDYLYNGNTPVYAYTVLWRYL